MILLVDIGNTRVKWATLRGGRLSPQQAAAHAGWQAEDWQRAVFGAQRFDRVLAASVAGAASERQLEDAAARSGVGNVEFVAASASAAGVVNAYPRPTLLGVDRWVAVIGAYHLYGRACCVVDVGTAATVDAVDAAGRHLGGFIVPGPHMMVRSLLAGTSDLAARTAASPESDRALLADNTRDAIERGCRVAIAALIDRTCAELARAAGASPVLVCTGGAAPEVLPYVVSAVEHVPDLVLHGLARLAAPGS